MNSEYLEGDNMTTIITDNTIITVYEKNDSSMSLDEIRKTPLSNIQAELMDGRNRKLEEEFEDTVRGELLNLRSIKKHLETAIHNKADYHSADFNYALTVVSSDVANLEKFVEERWGE